MTHERKETTIQELRSFGRIVGGNLFINLRLACPVLEKRELESVVFFPRPRANFRCDRIPEHIKISL